MRRIKSTTRGVAILFIVWSVTMAIGAAVAQSEEVIQVPIDTVVHGREGDVKLIDPPGVVTVPADRVGSRCSVHETSENNTSVHPNNDLIVTSGGDSVTLFDVESGSGVRVDGDGVLTLGETVKIEVRLGPDGVFSGGFIVGLCEVSCDSPALAIGVAPGDQEVVPGGDANFEVTVTNTGEEPFINMTVDSSVAACDHSSQDLLGLGQTTSYSCTATGVTEDLAATFAAAATGQDPTCSASANIAATVTVLQEACDNPALTITVVPMDQDVPVDGDASFQVTVTNSGDVDLEDVAVASSVAACDKNIGALAVGEDFSYSCAAAGVGGDFIVYFDADGRGVSDPEVCEALGSVAATVGNPTTTTTTMGTTTTTTMGTTTSSIPTRIDTGTGDAPGPAVPVGVLAVFGLGIAALAAGAYGVARKER